MLLWNRDSFRLCCAVHGAGGWRAKPHRIFIRQAEASKRGSNSVGSAKSHHAQKIDLQFSRSLPQRKFRARGAISGPRKCQIRPAFCFAGPELARELGEILDRDPHFEVQQLSDRAEGNQEDGLSENVDNLLNVDINRQTIQLQMERVNAQGNEIWLVSRASVARIPELGSLAAESPFEKKLPAPLVKVKLLGTSVWVWLALVLLALVLSLLSRLLSRIVLAVLRRATRRYAKALPVQRMEQLTEPLRLLVAVIVFRAFIEVLVPPRSFATSCSGL